MVFVHVMDQFSESHLPGFLAREFWFEFGTGLLDLDGFFITCVLYDVFTIMCRAYASRWTRSVGKVLCGWIVGRLLDGGCGF